MKITTAEGDFPFIREGTFIKAVKYSVWHYYDILKHWYATRSGPHESPLLVPGHVLSDMYFCLNGSAGF